MLPKRNRLRHSLQVQQVRRQGQSWRHPLVILLVTTHEDEVSRFAFVAGRSVGKAVVRNRAKRLLREAVRLNLPGILPGRNCLLIARPAIVGASFAEVETAVLYLLQRAQLLTAQTAVFPQKVPPT